MATRYSGATKCHGMTLRSDWTRANMFRWTSLPPELRLLILDFIVAEKPAGWASLSLVCREWQLHIQKWSLRRLRIKVPSLDLLETLDFRKRKLVRHIWLDIELPTYSCQRLSCKTEEAPIVQRRNDLCTSRSILRLFKILSTWGKDSVTDQGLMLELSVHSPSDAKHWFENYIFASADESIDTNDDGTEIDWYRAWKDWSDRRHAWHDGVRPNIGAPVPREGTFRIFRPLSLTDIERLVLPRVDIVTAFVVRRQLRRRLCARGLYTILRRLPGVETLLYETWKPLTNGSTVKRNDGNFIHHPSDSLSWLYCHQYIHLRSEY